jgi:hypothetical protein
MSHLEDIPAPHPASLLYIRKIMWPSLTGNQNDPEDTTDSSESLNTSVTTSIGIIGRKNLRADAPIFKTSSSEVTYPTSYEAIGSDLTGALDHENFYGQDTAIDYQPMYEKAHLVSIDPKFRSRLTLLFYLQ